MKKTAGQQFLREAQEPLALLTGILAVINPQQYQMGKEIKRRAMGEGHCISPLEEWASVYTAMTVLANRSTRYHRDTGSRFEWYDLLTSLGPYNQAPLYIGPIGLRINNPPGTVCAFSGMALSHAVREICSSRISMAFYIREDMRAGFGVQPAPFMTQNKFEKYLGHCCGRLRVPEQ